MSIENLTLAHFRHFSSPFTNLPAYKAADIYVPIRPCIYVPIRPCIYVPIRHYICREPSTNQLLFMQNKPNLLDAQMNVSSILTTVYENIANWTLGQNKPNSNPIKPNLQKAKMNVNSLITMDYRKKDDFAVRKNKPNSNPISSKAKMNANAFSQKDYENETAFRLQKYKPNQTQSSTPLIRVLPAPESSHRGFTLRGPAPKLRRLLITLFVSGYAGLGHSGSVYFQCAYPYSALLLLKKHAKKRKKIKNA